MIGSLYVFDWHGGTLRVNGVLLTLLVVFVFVPVVLLLARWWDA